MDPLQNVVEAQADFVDRLKKVNNEKILENGKKFKMKHKAMQESTESEQISLTPTIECMTLLHIRIKTNQFAIFEVFSMEPEELSQDADQNTQIEEPSQNADQNIQIKTEGTRIQQMEVDIQHMADLETEENLGKGKGNTQKMDTEEITWAI
ncbi:hypothetical protein F8M41_023164 [Gigaspora margarita]|uniref:Uncharacterized protein n=1 Tax=Gigaspora margarita TaxID=4874 RepID=A0A8H4ADX7_GIGMA|nr:hypothetical protein F8M41_023164 [Gigaspora margarita]